MTKSNKTVEAPSEASSEETNINDKNRSTADVNVAGSMTEKQKEEAVEALIAKQKATGSTIKKQKNGSTIAEREINGMKILTRVK